MKRVNSDVILALCLLVLALAALFIWVPADTGSGIVERVRGAYRIGDAFGPSVAFALLFLAAVVTAFEATQKSAESRSTAEFGKRNLVFLGILFAIFFVSLLVMRWVGPAVAGLLTEDGYRPLRASLPWKYLGYVSGGTLMVGSLISLAERRVTVKAFAIGFATSLILALLYDLPFDDFLLPPNGDL